MKKTILIMIIASLFGLNMGYAQEANGSKLSVGLELGLPVGQFANFYDLGLGFSAVYQKSIDGGLYVTGSLGYIKYTGDVRAGLTNLKYKAGYVPIKIGVRQYLTNGVYLGVETGASISSGPLKDGVAFAYSPGVGSEFAFGNKSKLDVGVRYEGWLRNTTTAFLGLRAAIQFGM